MQSNVTANIATSNGGLRTLGKEVLERAGVVAEKTEVHAERSKVSAFPSYRFFLFFLLSFVWALCSSFMINIPSLFVVVAVGDVQHGPYGCSTSSWNFVSRAFFSLYLSFLLRR
jgi:hypothetical protein